MAVCILGDIHFSSRKDYLIKICNDFIDWFSSWKRNNEENYLILAGDLVDNHVNGGVVIDFLERFIKSSKFKEVHIVVGNHDIKKYQNLDQLAYEFYESKSYIDKKIFIYKEPKKVQVGPLKVLMLPYYWGVNKEGYPMSEYYSVIYCNPLFKGHYDLTVGHFGKEDTTIPGAIDCVKNLDKLDTDRICLGHIHTRFINPDTYIGSVYACRRNENDYTRSAWVYDEFWEEERLPIFDEFKTITYPEPLPSTNAYTTIYTVLNCSNEKIAKDTYGDIYVRKAIPEIFELSAKKDGDVDFDFVKSMDTTQMFNDFVKIQNPPLSNEIESKCRNALGLITV